MKLNVSKLRRQVKQLKEQAAKSATQSQTSSYSKYRYDPAGYARDVLGVEWWSKQIEIAELLLKPPYRVLVKASHSVGKSHLAGGLVNWWYDTRDPGVCLTTAPTARQVHDILWKEVRRQRRNRPGFPGPKIPRLESSPWHFAFGMTANTGTSFQGQHEESVMIVLDEAVGVPREIWEAVDSMAMGVEHCLLAICNPTDTSSEFYQREQTGTWHVVHIPCTDHPNIAAELQGHTPLYPSAVRLSWLQDKLQAWANPVTEPGPLDIEFPPGSGQYLRPGPLAESRLLGRWPSAASGVWSDTLWQMAEADRPHVYGPDELPEIGVDVARFGDDMTEYHVRWGNRSILHECYNGLDNGGVIGHLRRLCQFAAKIANQSRPKEAEPVKPEEIYCKADSDGMGGRIVDHADGYNWEEIGAGERASQADDYPNMRSELWFQTTDGVKRGEVCLAHLPADVRRELKRQAISPQYSLDARGRRVVEPKQKTKKKLGRSPDGMDAMNLAYYRRGGCDSVATAIDSGRTPNWRSRRD